MQSLALPSFSDIYIVWLYNPLPQTVLGIHSLGGIYPNNSNINKEIANSEMDKMQRESHRTWEVQGHPQRK